MTRYQHLLKDQKLSIEQRRRKYAKMFRSNWLPENRLADLYQADQQKWERELESLRETPEMKHEKLLSKVNEIRQKIDEERKRTVEMQLNKKWR